MRENNIPPENTPEPRENLKKEIKELQRVVKALLAAIKEYENESGDPIMPTGEYYGINFK